MSISGIVQRNYNPPFKSHLKCFTDSFGDDLSIGGVFSRVQKFQNSPIFKVTIGCRR